LKTTLASSIEEITDKIMIRKWRKSNKCFEPFKSNTYKGFINRDFCNDEFLDLMHNPDRTFSEPVSSIIKDSHTTSSCVMPIKIGGGKVDVHIKRYNYQSILYALKNLFRTSRGKRVWKVANGLISRNIPTPLPISFSEQRKGRALIKSFFITQKIDQSLPLNTLLQESFLNAPAEAFKNKNVLIQQTAHLVRAMHDRGIWHGDLKSANILVEKKGGQENKLYLLDLDSARIKKRVERKDRIIDLARLNASLLNTRTVSTPDRLRFLKFYLNVAKKRDPKARDYWEAIVRQTQKKLKKSGRKFIT